MTKSNTSHSHAKYNAEDDSIPSVRRMRIYSEMLRAESFSLLENDPGRAKKRPRVSQKSSEKNDETVVGSHERPITFSDSSVYSESDVDDEEWENVDYGAITYKENKEQTEENQTENRVQEKAVDFRLGQSKVKVKIQRKVPLHISRQTRLEGHKMHLMCLLIQVARINTFLKSAIIPEKLKQIASPSICKSLKSTKASARNSVHRTRLFIDALKNCAVLWKRNWKITQPGIAIPKWKSLDALTIESKGCKYENVIKSGVENMQGSRDLGAMLFTAYLRSLGVETRLVCSFQVLPLASNHVSTQSPKQESKPRKQCSPPIVMRSENELTSGDDESSSKNFKDESSPTSSVVNRGIGMFRTPAFNQKRYSLSSSVSSSVQNTSRDIHDSLFPVFWSEALDPESQRWIPVDSLVTGLVDKPATVLEPPLSDPLNSLAYVIAFEADGFAKDVTLRYAKAYSAKTYKLRVESTEGGREWLKKVLILWRRDENNLSFNKNCSFRMQLEDEELAKNAEREPMPKSITDFVNHPVFALAGHLRKDEALIEKNIICRLTIGRGKQARTEEVIRRKDVVKVKSSHNWWRLGRIICTGEQPRRIRNKTLSQNRRSRKFESEDEEQDEANNMSVEEEGLYSIDQTEIFIPPAIENEQIPRNEYGYIDVFTETMVPPGAVHIEVRESLYASKLLGISYTQAVIGFEYSRATRKTVPIIKGVVVAKENEKGVLAVVDAFREQTNETNQAEKRKLVVIRWRKFLLGLRIRDRLNREYPQDLEEDPEDNSESINSKSKTPDNTTINEWDYEQGGGFI